LKDSSIFQKEKVTFMEMGEYDSRFFLNRVVDGGYLPIIKEN